MRPRKEQTLRVPGTVFMDFMRAVLEKGKPFRFRARGPSMTPFIRDGDTLTIAPLGGCPPRLGEVVAFSHLADKGESLVVHRVVGRQPKGFVIQGDGNGCTPEIIPSGSILGRVVKVERNGHCIRLGLGLERRLIAWLSRTNLFWKLAWPVWNGLNAWLRTFSRVFCFSVEWLKRSTDRPRVSRHRDR